MNIEMANGIALSEILTKMGREAKKRRGDSAWYLSPFRSEKTPSFHVTESKNIWYDFGATVGGKPIDLVCHYLKSQNECHTVYDGLRWMKNMTGAGISSIPASPVSKGTSLLLQKVQGLTHPVLIKYAEGRGISLPVAKEHLKQVVVKNTHTGATFFALGLPNEEKGYEVRNSIFKGCIPPKSISFIRGINPMSTDISIFEGMFDYLSFLEMSNEKRSENDVIILNSINCLQMAISYIKTKPYRNIDTWLDNDSAGVMATLKLQEFATEANIICQSKNKIYSGFKDLNKRHMKFR